MMATRQLHLVGQNHNSKLFFLHFFPWLEMPQCA